MWTFFLLTFYSMLAGRSRAWVTVHMYTVVPWHFSFLYTHTHTRTPVTSAYSRISHVSVFFLLVFSFILPSSSVSTHFAFYTKSDKHHPVRHQTLVVFDAPCKGVFLLMKTFFLRLATILRPLHEKSNKQWINRVPRTSTHNTFRSQFRKTNHPSIHRVFMPCLPASILIYFCTCVHRALAMLLYTMVAFACF